jgi:hypothetical protein
MSLNPEDLVAAAGGFDPRPVLSIHLAAERAGSVVNQPVPALALHNILEELLRGQIRATDDLVRMSRPLG